jgi:hypothetical protein
MVIFVDTGHMLLYNRPHGKADTEKPSPWREVWTPDRSDGSPDTSQWV